MSPYCSCDLHLIFPCSRRVCFCVGFKWKRRIASCYSLVAIRGVAVSTQSLREPADDSLVKQSESSTQSFAHWEVIGCSLALVCLCLLIVVPPLDSIGAVLVFAHLLHTVRFWNYCRYNYWHYVLDCTKNNHSYFGTQLMDCNNRIQVHRAEKIKAFCVRCLMDLGVFWLYKIDGGVIFFDLPFKVTFYITFTLS